MRFILILWTVALMACMLSGCAGPTTQTPGQYRAALARLSYPEQADATGNLDIHVVRQGNTVMLANRVPKRFQRMQLWLNGRFVRRIDTLAIGTGNRYPLNSFVNRHGERFPLPGLLSPRKTQPVVKAELYNPRNEARYRLTVQPDKTEDE